MAQPPYTTKGSLKNNSFAGILWRLRGEEASGVLELKRGEVAKRLFFQAGQPAHAESNLLHETLGKFLVEEGAITPDQEQAALVQALERQKLFSQVLIEQKLIDAARLYEATRKSMALKILDCFAWSDGEFEFLAGAEHLDHLTLLPMNPVRLIVRGIETVAPISLLGEGAFGQIQYRLGKAEGGSDEFQLTGEEISLLKGLKSPRTVEEIAKQSGQSEEQVARKLYAFEVLGLARRSGQKSEEVSLDELVSSTLLKTLKPAPPPAPPVAQADPEIQALANEIATDHMRLMALNYFELLGAPETAAAVEIRNRFVEFSTKYGPSRFRAPELGDFRERAEELFLRGVKAFSTLSDFDSKTKYIDKLKAERAQGGVDKKKAAADAFKIQTKLLDAEPQYQKGLKYLKEEKYPQAIEFFEYARDIDARRPAILAHLGWAKYLHAPDRNRKDAEALLRQAKGLEPESDSAAFLLGKFLVATGHAAEGATHLKRAAELSPKNIEMVREARNVEKSKR